MVGALRAPFVILTPSVVGDKDAIWRKNGEMPSRKDYSPQRPVYQFAAVTRT
jgi:hypothetical protein